MAPLLALRGICKRFGPVPANDDIDLDLAEGEVLGVLGENGAGKTTLMNVLAGLVQPDAGEIRLDGTPIRFASPREAIARGIGTVHQQLMLVPTLTAAENVALNALPRPGWRLSLGLIARGIKAQGEETGLAVDPAARIETLDMAGRQRVEILKALWNRPRVLVLDEPTTVLAESEREQLYLLVRRLRATGVAVILISHKLDDVYGVCDRVVVLRAGRVVDAAPLAERNPGALIRAMVGEDLPPPPALAHRPPGEPLLRLREVAARRPDGSLAFSGASFDLHGGEILGVAGVEGNGQRELAAILAGLEAPAAGRLETGDGRALGAGALARRRLGLRYIPADRHGEGVLAERAGADNFLLSHWFAPPFRRRLGLDRRRARQALREIGEAYRIAGRLDRALRRLSGGNQQKLVAGRELWGTPRLLVAAHPTRGLDLRTVSVLHEALRRQRERGVAVLLISADLGELWALADRILVLAQGRVRGPVPLAATSLEEVGGWMSGRRGAVDPPRSPTPAPPR